MKRQIQTILISILILLSTIVIIPHNVEAIAPPPIQPNPQHPGQEPYQIDKLDYTYIHSITDWLSRVILDSYVGVPLKEGRAYGSVGENDSANYLKNQMDALNLASVKKDQIKTINSQFHFFTNPKDESTEKIGLQDWLNINSESLTIHRNGQNDFPLNNYEFYISPRWKFQNELKYMSDFQNLTGSYEYSGVDIIPDPGILYLALNSFFYHLGIILVKLCRGDFNNLNEFFDYFLTLFEEDYHFSFDTFDPNNSSTYPSFYSIMNPPLGSYHDKFVFINEDPWNNPKFNYLNQFLDDPYNLVSFYWRFFALMTVQYFANRSYSNSFLGNILYDMDYNQDVHDMAAYEYMPLPVIFLNGNWKNISDSPESYTIDFSIDQTFQRNTKSYNVFGEIPGEDTSKTILVDCLYDGRWDEATADSAIGMGIVLAVAKTMKYLADPPYNIKPKYNVKFVAFGGEEAGFRGAFYYDAAYPDEKIIYVIDLNQVGFTERYEPLTFNIIMNNLIFSKTIGSLTAVDDQIIF